MKRDRQVLNQEDASAVGVRVVDTLSDLQILRSAWEYLHAHDPDSGFFLSWEWMNILFSENPGKWRVFFVCDDRAQFGISAILPLRCSFHWSQSRQKCQTWLSAAGRLGMSEYTGFICDPAFETSSLGALASHISQLPWSRFSMRYEPTGRRTKCFADGFAPEDFVKKWPAYTINGGETNQLIAPRVRLPEDYEQYLTTQVSAGTRKKTRRFTRLLQDSQKHKITLTTEETFERDVDNLQALWVERWEGTFPRSQISGVLKKQRTLIRQSLSLNALFMPVLWDGETVLGALARVVDRKTKTMTGIIASRNQSYSALNIGLLLHSYSIRWAISQGLEWYDFGHGTEPYKYKYGSHDHPLSYLSLERRSDVSSDVFDVHSLPAALRRLDTNLERGDENAQIIARQLAEVTHLHSKN